MKLKFLAREDLLVREAGITPSIGEASRYYGRTFDPATRGYPASKDPFEVDSESEDGLKCAKQCRKGALFAADETSAAALGVGFVDHEFMDGAHVAKSKLPAKAGKEAS